MKAGDLIGRRIRVVVAEGREPCRVRLGACTPLTATVEGRARRFIAAPLGAIGVVETDDGRMIAFDAGADIACGKIAIDLLDH